MWKLLKSLILNTDKPGKLMTKSAKVTTVILVFAVVFASGGEKPEWVNKPPIKRGYYIGIGFAEKTGDNKDHVRQAKNSALNELASEITINISSEIIDVISVQSGLSKNEFRSEIQSTTKANLEGFELIDDWEDDKEYWVYYRLSKAAYEKGKRLKVEKAMSLSKNLFDKAKTKERENKPADGLIFYKQAFYPIRDFITEPLLTDYEGSKIFLRNEIYSSLQSLISRIELRTDGGRRNAKVGKPLKEPLEIQAIYTDEEGVEYDINNLPVKFSFLRGSGSMVDRANTDSRGIAKINLAKVTSTDRLQIIKAELDLLGSVEIDSSSRVVSSILSNLTVPSVNVILNVEGLSVYFDSREKNLGENLSVQLITPKIKNLLSDKGFTFVDDMGQADLVIQFTAESRRGNVISDLYIAYVDLELSAIDLTSGDEVYSNALSNVKGIQLNYEKAGLKALENAYARMAENLLPELITNIQR